MYRKETVDFTQEEHDLAASLDYIVERIVELSENGIQREEIVKLVMLSPDVIRFFVALVNRIEETYNEDGNSEQSKLAETGKLFLTLGTMLVRDNVR